MIILLKLNFIKVKQRSNVDNNPVVYMNKPLKR